MLVEAYPRMANDGDEGGCMLMVIILSQIRANVYTVFRLHLAPF